MTVLEKEVIAPMRNTGGLQVLVSALSCNPRVGSEALVGYKYAESLARRHRVTLFASPPAEVPAGATLHAVRAGSCNFNDVAAAPLLRFEFGQLPRAWSLHRRRKFDVIHRVTPSWVGNVTLLPALRAPFVIGPLLAAERPPESFAPYLNRVARQPDRMRLHPARIAAGLAGRLNNWLSQRQVHLRTARKILVGNQSALVRVPDAWRGRCELVPYSGVEHDYFVPTASRPGAGPVRILFAGRLVPYKGLELLLRALAAVGPGTDLHLRIVGNGSAAYSDYCRSLASDLGLGDRVQFLSAVPRVELLSLYQETDIFCFPTLCDTYGIALLEAMSCGCAVVVSDVAGPGEIVTEGSGVKVPLHYPEQYIGDLADALTSLARSPRLRSELGQDARRRILAHHDWDAIGEQLLRIYEEL